MKVLVCGSRHWRDYEYMKHILAGVVAPYRVGDVTIIHGGATGADSIAGRIGDEFGCRVIEVPADWKTHGVRAGPIRNAYMLTMQPDLVIAFHEDLGKSKGTKDMITRAVHSRVPVLLYPNPLLLGRKRL